MWCDCVIFVTKNYILDNLNIADALSRSYREVRNKEFICKPYHTKLQHDHFSKVNSNYVEHSDNVGVMNSNDMTQSMELHMTSPDFTQNPKYTNHCICTCCHKPDLTRSQCMIFKASRYNFDNTVVSNVLLKCFGASTTKEFIWKKMWEIIVGWKIPVDARCRLQNTKQKIRLYCKGIPNKRFFLS